MHASPFTQVEANGGLTKKLHQKHQVLLLKTCIVGLYQPPLRQGLLRLLMPTSCVGDVECIYEECQ